MVSPSPSPAPMSRPTSEPDLFFPSSDSEGEEEIKPVFQKSTNGSQKVDVRSETGSSPVLGSKDTNGHAASASSLFNEVDQDIIAIDEKPIIQAGPSSSSSRKRPSLSRSPSKSIPPDFRGGYLGEFVCEGWSLSKGKGYCVPGSKIVFERPKAPKVLDDGGISALARSKEKIGPAKLINGKIVHAKGKAVTGKQMTLGAMGMGKKGTAVVCFRYSFKRDSLLSLRHGRSPRRRVRSLSWIKSFDLGESDLHWLATCT